MNFVYEELDDLKKIKKEYGEKMSHLCRELFPTLLETPGLLYHILSNKIAPNNELYNDIKNHKESFCNFIYSFINDDEDYEQIPNQSPFKLMNKAGYKLYKCKTEKDIQKFKKYYETNEVLCTIENSNRLKTHHVFFAVKKNVNEINRQDFNNPKREDEYGTSVISIQFSKSSNLLSIKNRYNHTVDNADATFCNNLENIIPGLTKAFENKYNFEIKQEKKSFIADSTYRMADDGKYYKVNYEIDNVLYCPNNIIIENGSINNVYAKEKERFIVMDYFVLDLKNKTIKEHKERIGRTDSFLYNFDEGIDSIEVTKSKDKKEKTIYITTKTNNQIIIVLDNCNCIKSYYNKNINQIENGFMRYSNKIKKIYLPNCKKIGDFFMQHATVETICLPSAISIGNQFMLKSRSPKNIIMDNVIQVGDDFLVYATNIEAISMRDLKVAGSYYLCNCNNPDLVIELESLEEIGPYGFCNTKRIKEFIAPNLTSVGSNLLYNCRKINNFVIAPKYKITKSDRWHEKVVPLYRCRNRSFLNNFIYVDCDEGSNKDITESNTNNQNGLKNKIKQLVKKPKSQQ